LFFNLRSAKKRLGWMNNAEVDAIAKDLGVTAKDVMDMEQRLGSYDASFDGATVDENDDMFAPVAYLEDLRNGPEELLENDQAVDQQQMRLQNAIATLDDRSRDIISKRWLVENKATLHELAAEYDISAERIRQIENNAMKKLKASFAT